MSNIPSQKCFAIARRFYTQYYSTETPGNYQVFLCPISLCRNAWHFCTKSPYTKTPNIRQAFLCPISVHRNALQPLNILHPIYFYKNTQQPPSISSKNIFRKKCLTTINRFSHYFFLIETLVGFPCQNEWRNIFSHQINQWQKMVGFQRNSISCLFRQFAFFSVLNHNIQNIDYFINEQIKSTTRNKLCMFIMYQIFLTSWQCN